jgi:hypothetical protein
MERLIVAGGAVLMQDLVSRYETKTNHNTTANFHGAKPTLYICTHTRLHIIAKHRIYTN